MPAGAPAGQGAVEHGVVTRISPSLRLLRNVEDGVNTTFPLPIGPLASALLRLYCTEK